MICSKFAKSWGSGMSSFSLDRMRGFMSYLYFGLLGLVFAMFDLRGRGFLKVGVLLHCYLRGW